MSKKRFFSNLWRKFYPHPQPEQKLNINRGLVRGHLAGRNLGKYRILAKLGRGGMAEIYKAYQPGFNRDVCIKVLHSHLGDDQDFVDRFEREVRALGKLRHPNIVQAIDFDREGDICFLVMEYVDGPTLKEELKVRRAAGKPFGLQEIARIITALCSAIDYAHTRGMVHRDIKPANVMINQEGRVVLTDFGIARIVGATQVTQTGVVAGTPAYMSPEQGQGERGDERSDIYSLGIMLYEMLTGTVPYDADTPFAVIMQCISEPLPLPTKINPDIPEPVERVILKAMSKDPNDRYQTAGEMAQALGEAVGLSVDDDLQRNPLISIALALKDQDSKRAELAKSQSDVDQQIVSSPGNTTSLDMHNDVVGDIQSVKREILILSRRLQKLRQIQALKGVDTEPHYLIEIEDIEKKVEQLQLLLKDLET